jgi:amino acid adenylation domain-containing protein
MKDPVIERFARHVRERPDATAVVGLDGMSSTYAGVDLAARRLETSLADAGVGPGRRVLIQLPLGADLVAALVAGRRRGATLVPVDADAPPARVAAIRSLAATAATIDAAFVAEAASQAPAAEAAVEDVERESPFQIVFTSGSTGRPKGVVLPVESVANRLAWMWDAYPMTDDDVMVAWKSPSLVASAWETLGGLLAGVPTVHTDAVALLDPSRLAPWLGATQATRMSLTPPLLRSLVDAIADEPGAGRRLRVVTCGAEALPADLAHAARAALPGCRLLNLYGLTECASNVAAFDLEGLAPAATTVPAGHPVAGSRIRIVDRWDRDVPVGVTGELVVAGPAVALGYLGDDGASGFGRGEDGRAFSTGDLGRRRSDGAIELAGRIDSQLNVKGYRVEPEEVEGWLERVPEITAAGVFADDDAVVAAVVPKPGAGLDRAAALALLRAHLPAHAVPARFVTVPALPRTRSGKVDRAALAAERPAEPAGLAAAALDPAGLDEAEAVVLAAWQAVLDAPPRATDDDFFESGGHSLLALRLVAELRERSGRQIALRAVIERSSFAGIAEVMRGAPPRDDDAAATARSGTA